MKSSWRDDVLCWRLTVPRRRAHHVRSLLNHVHVQDRCSCLSATRRRKPTVFSLSTCFFSPPSARSRSVAIAAAAAVYPRIVFTSRIAHLIFVCCLPVHECLPPCSVGASVSERCRGKKELHQFHTFDNNASIFWKMGVKCHSKRFLEIGACKYQTAQNVLLIYSSIRCLKTHHG